MTLNVNFSRGLLALACVSTLSLTAHADSSWKPYVGAGVGYSVVETKNNHYTLAGIDGKSYESAMNAKGAVESLFLGIQKQVQHMALGAELYGYLSQQVSKMKNSDSLGNFNHETMKRKYGYGAKVKAGYFVNPSALAYAHVGIESARFQYAGTIDINSPLPFKKNKSLVGFPFGAGLEVDVASAWKARLEYTYTKYKTW